MINMNKITVLANKGLLYLKKISPELTLAGGIACGIGAVVAGCMASRKVDTVIKDTHDELDDIQNEMDQAKDTEDADLVKELKSDTIHCYVKLGGRLAKLYGPTVFFGMASIGLILASHGILNKRYLGTAAAYKALDEAFKGYRERVASAMGLDAEKFLFNGTKVEKNVKEELEDGSFDVKKGNNLVTQKHKNAPYEFDFNAFTAPTAWSQDVNYINVFLQAQQNYANDLLHAQGHLFLNEVLDMLGLERTPEGQIVGWMLKGDGDGFVDFGMTSGYLRDFETDTDLCKKNVHLNFNVDGVIYDMIGRINKR